jgi:hypothetical protein
MNNRAKAVGRYLAIPFSEIPRSPGTLLDRPDTADSDERIRKVRQYLAGVRPAEDAAVARAEMVVENVGRAPIHQGPPSAEHNERDVTDTSELHVRE